MTRKLKPSRTTDCGEEIKLTMSIGDLQLFTEAPFGNPGTNRFSVQLGVAASINPGEPVVVKGLGASGTSVATMATNKPLVGTDWIVGVSQSFSTDTVTANGTVDVYDIYAEGVTFLANPNSAAAWDTQAEYDALVGSRVLLDKTSGAYTVLATDAWTISAKNGVFVEPLDITKHPGKVRISFNKNNNPRAQLLVNQAL
jgi:hypothetical protein